VLRFSREVHTSLVNHILLNKPCVIDQRCMSRFLLSAEIAFRFQPEPEKLFVSSEADW